MVRKLMSLFVIMIFLVGVVPIAVAQHDSADSEESSGDSEVMETRTDTRSRTLERGDSTQIRVSEKVRDGNVVQERQVRQSNDDGEVRVREVTRVRVGTEEVSVPARDVERTGGRVTAETRFENKEALREHQRDRLLTAVNKCREHSDNPALCEEKLRQRMVLVDRLPEEKRELYDAALERQEMHREEKKDALKEIHLAKFKESGKLKARVLGRDHAEAAHEKREAAKQKFDEYSRKSREDKGVFEELKERINACGEDESSLCADARREIISKAMDRVGNALDMMEAHVGKLRAAIEGNEDLTDGEAAESLLRVEEAESRLAELQEEFNGLGEGASKEDITMLARKIAAVWKDDVRPVVRHQAGFIQASKLGGLVVAAKRLQAKLDGTLLRAAESGIDTSAVNDEVDRFNGIVADFKSKQEEAVGLFDEAKLLRGEQRNIKISEAHEAVREAKSLLKEEHALIKSIRDELRAMHVEMEDETDDVLEEVEDPAE
jgi:hypothetical protein